MERRIHRRQECNCLGHSVLRDFEVFLCQVGDVFTVARAGNYRNRHEISINLEFFDITPLRRLRYLDVIRLRRIVRCRLLRICGLSTSGQDNQHYDLGCVESSQGFHPGVTSIENA